MAEKINCGSGCNSTSRTAERELADPVVAVRPGPLTIPGVALPLEAEREAHELTHLPATAWCEYCQRAKPNDGRHMQLGGDASQSVLPTLCMDFAFHGVDGEGLKDPEQVTSAVTLIVVDGGTGYPLAVTAPSKGGRDLDYFARAITNFAALLRFRKMRLFSDQEPSMKDLGHKVVRLREGHETMLHYSPVGSSASNGRAERMIQTVRKQALALKLSWESQFGIPLLGQSCLLPWLFRRAAWLLARYHVKATGRTAYEDVNDAEFRQEILPWGEVVIFRLSSDKKAKLPKTEVAWLRGVWVGKTDASAEHLLLTPTGATRSRTVRRLPRDRAHDRDFVKLVKGVPWDMGAGAVGRPRTRTGGGVGSFPVAVPLYPGVVEAGQVVVPAATPIKVASPAKAATPIKLASPIKVTTPLAPALPQVPDTPMPSAQGSSSSSSPPSGTTSSSSGAPSPDQPMMIVPVVPPLPGNGGVVRRPEPCTPRNVRPRMDRVLPRL